LKKQRKLKRGGDYHSLQDAFLISAHSFVGGARSKAVGAINLKTKEVFLGNRNITIKRWIYSCHYQI
jgi:serine/threonine-protein kinase HipA